MNVDEMLTGARDAMRASIVFGEPVERDGLTVIPAAKVRGGGWSTETPTPPGGAAAVASA